jgi:hypothetical protein
LPTLRSFLPKHILRRDQPAAGDQHGRDRDRRTRLGKARQHQKRGREQRRRIGRSPEHTDIAALHPDIPGTECGTHRADAERSDRQPLRRRIGPDRDFDEPMHHSGEQRGRQTEARHRVRRYRFELARHHRIGRPHKGRDKGREQSGQLARRETAAAIAGKQEHRAGEPQQGADDVVRRQPFAGQQRRKQHNQQRPAIIQQPGFRRRREAQRQEIQRVITEQPADPDDPRRGPLPQRANRPSGRPIHVRDATRAPIANVIAASWNAGIFPVATVSTASSDHIRIAVSPISVAVREVMRFVIASEAKQSRVREARNGLLRRKRSSQ